MFLERIVTCVSLLAPSLASAAVVVTDTNILLSDGGGLADYALTVYQDAAGTDPTSIFFDYDGANVEVVTSNIDEASDWYVVDAGDEFTRQNIAAGLFTAIVTSAVATGPVPVDSGDFYLGVSTGQGFGMSGPNRDSFGWIELTSSVGVLANAGNAVAYDAHGIVVGTAIPIPEPLTADLLTFGLLGLAAARRRSRGHGAPVSHFPCRGLTAAGMARRPVPFFGSSERFGRRRQRARGGEWSLMMGLADLPRLDANRRRARGQIPSQARSLGLYSATAGSCGPSSLDGIAHAPQRHAAVHRPSPRHGRVVPESRRPSR